MFTLKIRMDYRKLTAGPFGTILSHDITWHILEYCIQDRNLNTTLYLCCKMFNAIISTYWRKRYPKFDFNLVPRPPNLIPRHFAIIPKRDYNVIRNQLFRQTGEEKKSFI